MKRLLILRHAKAVAKDAAHDVERELAARGRAQMKAVAARLADMPAPDLALVSPAARTRETWALAKLPEVPVRFEAAIYEAEAETLLALIRTLPDEVGAAILVGHNPGVEELAASLAARDARGEAGGEAGELRAGLPTAALVVLDFDAAAWSAIRPGEGRLAAFVTPRSLGLGDA